MADNLVTDTAFDTLALHPALMQGVGEAGFTHCTPIQALSLPLLLKGQDVLGQAQTGTGKSAAFLLATMNRLINDDNPGKDPRAVILAPTRELAIQIHKDAVQLSAGTGLRLGLVYGGIDYDKQREQFTDGLDILVGTPGRFIDYFKQRCFSLDHVSVVVLDEADRMFDLGFIKDIRYLLRRMPDPEKRQSMLFSATLTFRVAELAYEHMNNPETVSIEPDKRTADQVTQLLYHVGSDEKLSLLIGLFRRELPSRTLVFVNTKRTADIVEATLRVNGIEAETLSGDVPQRKRQRLIGLFASGEIACIVATDVAARGLHIPDVSHVVNYDLPQNCEDYVHRIGRTARAGASGDAISLACEQYVFSLQEIQEYLGHPIPTAEIDDDLLVATKKPARIERRRPPGPRKGSGGRGKPRRSNQRSRG